MFRYLAVAALLVAAPALAQAPLKAPIMGVQPPDLVPPDTQLRSPHLKHLEQEYNRAKWRYWVKHPDTPQPELPQ